MVHSNQLIFLIGFMGSGKTTVGSVLARNLNAIFLDTDELIEAQAGFSISEIFKRYGEPYFRELETDLMKQLTDEKEKSSRKIISVGGGLPVREENRLLMKSAGTTIFLEAREDTLFQRLQGDTTRPLLSGNDLAGRIHSMIETRLSAYLEAADVRIQVDDRTPEEIAGEIAGRL